MSRRATTLLWVAATALVLAAGTAACSDDEGSEASNTTETATPADVACPEGTEEDDRLCVAATEEAEESASLIRGFFDDGDFNALIVGVWQDEEPVVVGALGQSMTDVPATVDMHHRIGNISAPFLTTVFLQLVDEGVVALDDTLDTWYPDLPAADQITLADLARSTSGYEHHPATDGFLEAFYDDPFQHWSPDELIAFGTADGTSFEPGTDWQFSDTNLLILGEVLEAATGESTHTMIRERILEPEGLDNTTTPETALLADPVLHGFTDERGVWEEATFWNPTWVPYGGDMASNQEDVARWIEMVARGDLLPPELHEEQLAPETVGLGRHSESLYYAMGIGVTNGWVYGNPSLQGYRASVGSDAETATTIVIYATVARDGDEDARPDPLFQELGTLVAPDNPPGLDQRD